MSTYYQDANTTILHGDCIEVMRTMPENSVDSIVTDPPYGLGFMGKKWDSLPPGEEWARECLRVLKPGGHLLAFGGPRTWHRLAVAIEDAGFEIRDGVMWLYGSGFPKSHDISKAIDKMAGAEREVIGDSPYAARKPNWSAGVASVGLSATPGAVITAPATPEAQQWEGWGTALKPAYEPAVMARKPFTGTVAGNVLKHGTGAINIDATRIEANPATFGVGGGSKVGSGAGENQSPSGYRTNGKVSPMNPSGRFPANLILDEHTAELLDEQSGNVGASGGNRGKPKAPSVNQATGIKLSSQRSQVSHGDHGGASRFFYVAKAPKTERPNVGGVVHPTVKPLALMRWLCKMVTPTGGTILDPFAGSGTTIEAALIEGFNVIGIERETEYLPLIQHRINRANEGKPRASDSATPIKETLFPKIQRSAISESKGRFYRDIPGFSW